jgi:ABC-2 type transport system permease protein
VIWRIANKEFTEIIRDGRFIWTSIILVVLFLVAMATGAQRYSIDRSMRAAAATEERGDWLSQGDQNPHTAAHHGVYAFKPATPLALFDPGYDDYTGTLQYVEAHVENRASFPPAADGTSLQRFGAMSGATVLQLLTPLLIFLLTYAMVAGEREDGTLRQVLSVGVPRSTLIAGKALGALMGLGIVLIPTAIIGGVVAAFTASNADPHDLVDLPAKVAVLAGAHLVFFLTLICLSLAVSMLSRSSAMALTGLIAFWIITALLIPRGGAELSRVIYPTPSSFKLEAEIERGRDAGIHPHEPNHPHLLAFKNRMLEKYHVKRVEDLPYSFTGLSLQADEDWGDRVFDQTYGKVREIFAQQNQLRQALGTLSPFVAIKAISSALSGTDVEFSNDFSSAAEDYRRTMMRTLNRNIMTGTAGMTDEIAAMTYKANGSLWKKIPPFDYDPPRLGTILSRNFTALVCLAGWLAASLAFLVVAVRLGGRKV